MPWPGLQKGRSEDLPGSILIDHASGALGASLAIRRVGWQPEGEDRASSELTLRGDVPIHQPRQVVGDDTRPRCLSSVRQANLR